MMSKLFMGQSPEQPALAGMMIFFVLPGNYGGGLLVAPDQESWGQLCAWAGQRLPQLGL